MRQLLASLKKWFSDLYLVVFAFAFITIGGFLTLLPGLKNTIWQTIGGAMFASGFAILVSAITARQSSFEQYKKDANLTRKTEVYGPLHSELKELRKTLDEVLAGRAPYPHYIGIHGDSFRPTLIFGGYKPPTFTWWPQFRENYHIDDFTPSAQKFLNELQSGAEAYNKATQAARNATQGILRTHIAASIKKEEQRSSYQEWRKRGQTGPYTNETQWLDFIKRQTEAVFPDRPLALDLSRSWTPTTDWLLADRADKAAEVIYDTDAHQWGAHDVVGLSWFTDIFNATLADLKNDPAYVRVMAAQEELFKRLQQAEKILYEGLRYIRDRYEGGTPPV